ncbi:conserved hypothetical protein [Acidianus hospitalis W1]|uniref:Teichoic acid transporter n=1 Tax=Acidianus hospitalis (strain W1) TaxID=933801 RepID=F4B9P3_ACIHW|nr:hypothetical protein [Acidianus hospitalis]AEE93959.1 conserved hypothetical protein [Acidianus hospitalis W1]
MLKTKKSPGFVRIGLFNLLVKTAVAPISFLFSFLVVRYLSSISIETFGVWQYIYVLITGYFTIPADLFSSITSRYSAEGKNVGGIIIINALAGSISSFAYFLLIPTFMHSAGYNQPIYFYTAILLIVLIYLNRISGSIAIGRSPRLTAISASGFQIVRLLSAIIMMFYLNLSINAVIFAYSLGYLVQIIFNLTFVNARLGIDFKVALSAVRKSIVFIMNYVQLMIEATLVWVVVFIVNSAIPVSYFESALIISNLVGWSQAATDGLILKLQESRDPKLIEIAIKFFFTTGGVFLLIIFVDGERLLYVLRPEYVSSIYALIVLSFSTFIRSAYNIFYRAIYMADESLAVESKGEFRGYTAKLTTRNVIISVMGVSSSLFLLYLFKYGNVYKISPILAVIISLALLVNSLGMFFSSYSISKRIYGFNFPVKEVIVSLVLSVISSLPFIGLSKVRVIEQLIIMLEMTSLALTLYIALSYIFNPYARDLLHSIFREIKNFKL